MCSLRTSCLSVSQLVEAVSGRFNPHVHVEYDWNLRLDELDESDDELDDKVTLSKPRALDQRPPASPLTCVPPPAAQPGEEGAFPPSSELLSDLQLFLSGQAVSAGLLHSSSQGQTASLLWGIRQSCLQHLLRQPSIPRARHLRTFTSSQEPGER